MTTRKTTGKKALPQAQDSPDVANGSESEAERGEELAAKDLPQNPREEMTPRELRRESEEAELRQQDRNDDEPQAAHKDTAADRAAPLEKAAPRRTARKSAATQSIVKRPAKKAAKKAGRKRAAHTKPEEPTPETRYFSRDESWLRFNLRVLEEAQDEKNPLLERVKFLAITASNLDEFVEIRVAGILQRIEDGIALPQTPDEAGLTQQERLDHLSERMSEFVAEQYRCWNKQLLPAMAQAGIRILRWKEPRGPRARPHVLPG
jgi:hypothetical protein